VETLAERILFLKGTVEMKLAEVTQQITIVSEMLAKARAMEEGSARDYNLWANECAANTVTWRFNRLSAAKTLQPDRQPKVNQALRFDPSTFFSTSKLAVRVYDWARTASHDWLLYPG